MTLEARSEALDQKLAENDIDKSIETLVMDAQRRRRQVKLLTMCIILVFITLIGLIVMSFRTDKALRLAQTNKAAVIQNCETANDSRRNQRQLWGYVLSLTPQQPRSEEQEARVKEFSKFVDITFAPRDCQGEANV